MVIKVEGGSFKLDIRIINIYKKILIILSDRLIINFLFDCCACIIFELEVTLLHLS